VPAAGVSYFQETETPCLASFGWNAQHIRSSSPAPEEVPRDPHRGRLGPTAEPVGKQTHTRSEDTEQPQSASSLGAPCLSARRERTPCRSHEMPADADMD